MRLLGVLMFAATVAAQAPDTALRRTGFIAGCWETKVGTQSIREDWRVVTPDFLVGTGTTVAGGVVREFEFQRVLSQRGSVAYIAQPNGARPTTFALDPSSPPDHAVFVNMNHDYPKRVAYEKVSADAMTAWIDDGAGSKKVAFAYTRCQ